MKKYLIPMILLWALVLTGCGEKTPEEWTLKDFDGCFEKSYETETETYLLLEGTNEENTVHVLRGKEEGPVVYIVAGVHGDEQAGWRAGNLLKTATIKAGTVYIVSPANVYGAQQDQRRTKEGWDLNRSFPGDAAGGDGARIARSIFEDMEEKQPALVLDLHEAIPKEDDYAALGANYDALGNSLICYSLDGIGDLVLDFLMDSEAGKVCSTPFILYNAPPEGSVNHTAFTCLETPAITVETLRSDPLATRVHNQLEVVEYALTYYGLR